MANQASDQASMKLWGGRFSQGMDTLMEKFNNSLRVDQKLWKADLKGSMAYAKALNQAGLLTESELEMILSGLDKVHREWDEKTFVTKASDEDIHTANERRLSELIGSDVGGKLHTGRSRNDQSTTDVRLWLKEEIGVMKSFLMEFLKALVQRAEKDMDFLMPGYTHLQRAQPIRWSHWVMSQACDFSTDLTKLTNDVFRSVDIMSLGSGALAGNPFAINREQLAKELGFGAVSFNSLSATSSRDYIADMLFWCAQVGTHLSRFAEDLIIYSSKEFSFVRLSDAYSTGSSIMPQKKNPDSLELIRGKAGSLIGKLTGFLVTMKGLPSTYNKDMQEDKEVLFSACETVSDMIRIATGVIATLTPDPTAMTQALSFDMLATDLAYYLVRKGMPFRAAHEISGKVVQKSETKGCKLNEISLQELQEISPLFEEDVMNVWNYYNSVEQYQATGGTSVTSIVHQIEVVKKLMNS